MLKNSVIITGSRAIARSYAKINLTLDVLGKRDNGYHDVKMLMQTTSLFDLVIVDKADSEITVSTNLKYLPNNDKNIAYQAVLAFLDYTKIRGGAKIIIHKNIPVAAGLAGGSSNAAAVLVALDMLYNTGLTDAELVKIGATLGADVPYCIIGGTQLASGIGEILTPAPPLPDCHILLVKPPVNISTKLIYEEIDEAEITNHPDTDGMIKALNSGDLYEISKKLSNVMETVTQEKEPQIRGIKEKMLKNGALGALMSGSGPTVFGIFDDYKKAKESADSFYYQFRDVYLVKNHT